MAQPRQLYAQGVTSSSAVFYMNYGGNFFRSDQPFNVNDPNITIAQSVNQEGVQLGILRKPNYTAYTDADFRYFTGALSQVRQLLIRGHVEGTDTFYVNLWFDVSRDGQIFSWVPAAGCEGSSTGSQCDRFSGLGGDGYSLGPPDQSVNRTPYNGSVVLSGSSAFYMVSPCAGNTYTLNQLGSGACAGISNATQVEVIAGILGLGVGVQTNPNGLSYSAFIAVGYPGGGYLPTSPRPDGIVQTAVGFAALASFGALGVTLVMRVEAPRVRRVLLYVGIGEAFIWAFLAFTVV